VSQQKQSVARLARLPPSEQQTHGRTISEADGLENLVWFASQNFPKSFQKYKKKGDEEKRLTVALFTSFSLSQDENADLQMVRNNISFTLFVAFLESKEQRGEHLQQQHRCVEGQVGPGFASCGLACFMHEVDKPKEILTSSINYSNELFSLSGLLSFSQEIMEPIINKNSKVYPAQLFVSTQKNEEEEKQPFTLEVTGIELDVGRNKDLKLNVVPAAAQLPIKNESMLTFLIAPPAIPTMTKTMTKTWTKSRRPFIKKSPRNCSSKTLSCTLQSSC
jgi:hypothetical protein